MSRRNRRQFKNDPDLVAPRLKGYEAIEGVEPTFDGAFITGSSLASLIEALNISLSSANRAISGNTAQNMAMLSIDKAGDVTISVLSQPIWNSGSSDFINAKMKLAELKPSDPELTFETFIYLRTYELLKSFEKVTSAFYDIMIGDEAEYGVSEKEPSKEGNDE